MGNLSAQCEGTIGRAGENSAHHKATSQLCEEKERNPIKELTDDGGCARIRNNTFTDTQRSHINKSRDVRRCIIGDSFVKCLANAFGAVKLPTNKE